MPVVARRRVLPAGVAERAVRMVGSRHADRSSPRAAMAVVVAERSPLAAGPRGHQRLDRSRNRSAGRVFCRRVNRSTSCAGLTRRWESAVGLERRNDLKGREPREGDALPRTSASCPRSGAAGR